MAAVDLAARVERRAKREARRADLARRDAEHGGMISIDRLAAEQQQRETLRDWRAYRPSVTADEVQAARRGEIPADPRRVTLQRAWIDCGAAVRRFAPAYKRDAAQTLRNDALLLLVRWPSQGTEPPLDLGGENGFPLRRDWIERREDGREYLTRLAWRALLAAVKQAASGPAARAAAEVAEHEVSTDPLDLTGAIEQQQRETDAPTRLPDAMAPETLAELLDLSLDAARAIVARAYPAATRTDLAESWAMSADSVKVALSRGAAAVRDRFPDASDLLAALDGAAETYHRASATAATLALLDLSNGRGDLAAAELAAADWRALAGDLPAERRALLVAALNAARRARARGDWSRLDPERIAASVARLTSAERRRARQHAERAEHGTGYGASVAASASAEPLARFSAPEVLPAAPRPVVGPQSFSRYGTGYGGACSVARIYRASARA